MSRKPATGPGFLDAATTRLARYWRGLVPVAMALVLAACGEDAVAPEPTVASVTVAPAADTLISLGETVQLSASALDATGNVIRGWVNRCVNVSGGVLPLLV